MVCIFTFIMVVTPAGMLCIFQYLTLFIFFQPVSNKLQLVINFRIRVRLQDSRSFEGIFKAYDKHMNIVLGDCTEVRKIGPKKEPVDEHRTLGFVLLRGDFIVGFTTVGPPVADEGMPRVPMPGMGGPGMGKSAGRGYGPGPMQQRGGPPMMGGPPPGMMGPAHGRGPRGPPQRRF